MKAQLDMEKIARGLGAERRGKITTSGGYLGAKQLLADIEARSAAISLPAVRPGPSGRRPGLA